MKEQISEFKERAFSNLSIVSLAMGAPARLRIIQALSNRAYNVEDLSARIEESIANTSQHLQKLKKAGLVHSSKDGAVRTYFLSGPRVLKMFLEIQKIASEFSPEAREVEEKFCPSVLQSVIPVTEVMDAVRKKKVLLIDVRDVEEFKTYTAEGALSFPCEKLAKNLKILSKKKPVYAFCRGRYCLLANEVVKKLRQLGYEAYRLKEMAYELNEVI